MANIIYYRKSAEDEWQSIPALKGEPGHTPVKGVDYFTDEELAIFATVEYVDKAVENVSGGNVDLSDYLTAAQVQTAINNSLSAIGVAEDGAY